MIMSLIKYCLLLLFIILNMNKIYASNDDASISDNIIEDSLFYPNYSYEYVPDYTYEEIEERFNQLETEIPMNFNSRVKAFIDYFSIKDREYTKMVLGRLHLYFPIFEKYFREYDIPEEIKYLSIIESGLNPKAISPVGAVGLWQFMPATARMYGLHIDWYIDERMDPIKSTEAAAKYIKTLYNMFGDWEPEKSTIAACKYMRSLYEYFKDWELVLAAYNTGPGNVRKAIRRSGYKTNFWKI